LEYPFWKLAAEETYLEVSLNGPRNVWQVHDYEKAVNQLSTLGTSLRSFTKLDDHWLRLTSWGWEALREKPSGQANIDFLKKRLGLDTANLMLGWHGTVYFRVRHLSRNKGNYEAAIIMPRDVTNPTRMRNRNDLCRTIGGMVCKSVI